jgi:hypothetical protein
VSIGLAVFLKSREVVNEGGVDHAIRCSRSAAQAREIVERAALNGGPYRGKRGGSRIRPSEAEYLVPGGN